MAVPTAIVVGALLDVRMHLHVVREVLLSWNRAYSTAGFFWYSSDPRDAVFVVNASAVMAAVIATAATSDVGFTRTEEAGLIDTVRTTARMISNASRYRADAPYWDYMGHASHLTRTKPNDLVPRTKPNDLGHHAMILSGMENIRALDARLVPWSREDAADSLHAYCTDGTVFEYAHHDRVGVPRRQRPARLFGVALAADAYLALDQIGYARRLVDHAVEIYGAPFPTLRGRIDVSVQTPWAGRDRTHLLAAMARL